MKRRAAACGLLVATLLPCAAWVQAQQKFPAKPVQFVVPNTPGGSNDIFARAIGKRLAEAWGQAVVIENKPGNSATLGSAYVAKAAPDGHSILMASSSFATNAASQANLPFDPVKSFTPVALIGKGPFILAVSNGVQARTVADLVAMAKAKPGTLNYASSGPGSINQFVTELFKSAAGIQITHVPYKGMGPATSDLIGGHVEILIASVPSLMTTIRSGKVRGLGVTSSEPSAAAPGLPAIAQSGVPGYNAEIWWGVLAPAGTPQQAVSAINAEINRALATSELKEFLQREGAEPTPTTPEGFGTLLRADIQRWQKVAKDAGIKAE